MRDCSRPAAGLLWEMHGAAAVSHSVSSVVLAMLAQHVNSPLTSSVGRLFDAAAYLAGVAQQNCFEGQAAMAFEGRIGNERTREAYAIEHHGGVGDWAPLVDALVRDRRANVDVGTISARFHNALANWIVEIARKACVRDVVLSGGVFQNAYLTECACQLLEAAGFRAFTHHQVPANDGGIALGQAVLAGTLAV